MFGKQPKNNKILDGEKCLSLWLMLGSLAKVQARLTNDGVVSNRTGNPVSRTGIQHSAQRWILRNPQLAWDRYLKDFFTTSGENKTFDAWLLDLKEIAVNNLTTKGYEKFVEKWSLN